MALARWQATIVDDAGNVQASASIEVRSEEDNTLVSVYSDRAGATPLGNPFTADSEGFAAFHVAGGAYKITATKGGFSRIWRYVAIGTAQELDSDSISTDAENISFTPAGDLASTNVQDALEELDSEKASINSIREKLTSARTYYVRTDGSDSNTGLVDSSGGGFLTIQKAWDTILTLDLSGFTVTIDLGDGTYTGGLSAVVQPVGGNVTLQGNTSNPENVIISTTSVTAIEVSNNVVLTVQNLEIRTTAAGHAISASAGARVNIGDGVRFGATAYYHMIADTGGVINAQSKSWSIVGNATIHMEASSFGTIMSLGGTITIGSARAFSIFARGQGLGFVNAWSMTFSGAGVAGTTGQRYVADGNGAVFTNAGGPTYFPGNTAGAATVGGQYY